MSQDKIKCPKCGHQISVDEAIVQRAVETKVKNRLSQEKEQLIIELKNDFELNQKTSLKTLQEKLTIAENKRREAEIKELDFIKKQTNLEDKIRRQEIDIARKIQDERRTIIEKTQKESEEKFQLLNGELRKQLEDTKKALTDAQRKAQQGSMQTQGEVLELALEETLKTNFPHDEIKPVPKGINGADIIQVVRTATGRECGSIVWESKQTKAWTEDWVQKLKDDGQNIKGSILVLISEALPKEVKIFGLYKGIWVSNYSSILGLTMALRSQLISTAKVLFSQSGKEEKKDILYDYLCSPVFANRIESIAENFLSMKNTLEREKIVINKSWAAREMQINRMVENTTKMYGEISGIAGAQLPTIELLELESGTEIEKPKKDTKNKKDDTTKENQTGLF